MNNQNNNSLDNSTSLSSKVIILIDLLKNRHIFKVRQGLVDICEKNNWGILEIIESQGQDDLDALRTLSTLVATHDFKDSPLNILIEDRAFLIPFFLPIVLGEMHELTPSIIEIFEYENFIKYGHRISINSFLRACGKKDLLDHAYDQLRILKDSLTKSEKK